MRLVQFLGFGSGVHSNTTIKQTNKGRYEMKALTTLLVIGMFATAVAMADDVDDVRAAVQRYVAALNAGDANAFIQLQAAINTRFAPGGGLLDRSDSLEERRKAFQASVDAGLTLLRQTTGWGG